MVVFHKIVVSIGIGGCFQLCLIGSQASVTRDMIPFASSMVIFSQLVGTSHSSESYKGGNFSRLTCFDGGCAGGSVGIAIGGAIINTELAKNLAKYAPDVPQSIAGLVENSVQVR
jgi:hypothetical protein